MQFLVWVFKFLLILSFSHLSLQASPACSKADRAALLGFKARISKDTTGILSSWTGLNCCNGDWEGIQCNPATGRVTQLQLQGPSDRQSVIYMKGTLSPSLGNLHFLEVLIISGMKRIAGAIPQSLSTLNRLTQLILDHVKRKEKKKKKGQKLISTKSGDKKRGREKSRRRISFPSSNLMPSKLKCFVISQKSLPNDTTTVARENGEPFSDALKLSRNQTCPSPSPCSKTTIYRSQLVEATAANEFKFVLYDALDSSSVDTTHARVARDSFCSQDKRLSDGKEGTGGSRPMEVLRQPILSPRRLTMNEKSSRAKALRDGE